MSVYVYVYIFNNILILQTNKMKKFCYNKNYEP